MKAGAVRRGRHGQVLFEGNLWLSPWAVITAIKKEGYTMRVIDADALKRKAQKVATEAWKLQIKATVETVMNQFIEFIDKAPTIGGWISVKDRLPAETHSIFYPWFGKKQWNKAMWREQSDKVLVTVAFKDGTRIVTTGETHDGVWNTTISRTLEPVVTHWMPLPEPKEED